MTLDKEWDTARDVIARGDERVDGLRKYGFSFVTTLLTADALVLHSATDGHDGAAIPWIAVGVSVIACVLVVAMRVLDKNTELLQRAAAQRAYVIERHIGLELTDIITERARAERWSGYINWLYAAFVLAVVGVGFLAGGLSGLSEDSPLPTMFIARVAVLAITVLVSWGCIYAIATMNLKYQRDQENDWSVDRVECTQGETVRVMSVRVSEPRSKYDPARSKIAVGDVLWQVELQPPRPQQKPAYVCLATDRDVRDNIETRVWLWDTSGAKAGLYDLVVDPGKKVGGPVTLHRRIRVNEPSRDRRGSASRDDDSEETG